MGQRLALGFLVLPPIPNGNTIIEVENVTGSVSLTSQIKDMMVWAQQQPVPYTLQLWVNQAATLTKPLQDAEIVV
jgi:hypothetical protein